MTSGAGIFVGPVRPLARGEHPDWGGLLVVLRNGRPERVVPPGSKVWRGLRAPVTGSLQVASVNDGTVEVNQIIRDVFTAGQEGYAVERIPVVARIRLNHHND